MSTRILLVGIALPIRARLQGCLSDVVIEPVRSVDGMHRRLKDEAFGAVVINEDAVDEPLLPFLDGLSHGFSGTVVFCASQQHSARDLRQMVHACRVAVVLQHPIDASELLRGLAIHLGLQVRQSKRPTTHSEEEVLERVWNDSQELLLQRLELLDQVASGRLQGNPGPAWRAAHFLAGTLGSFRLERGTLLAREAEKMIGASLEGAELDKARLTQVVKALRKQLAEQDLDQLTSWVDSTLVVVSDDMELLSQLVVEALLQHWGVVRCKDLRELAAMVGEHDARVVLLDPESGPALRDPEAVSALLHDSLTCVVLSVSPQPERLSRHVTWLSKPVWPAELMRAVLRAQVAPVTVKPPAVLMLDTDRVMLKLASATLTQLGFDVQALSSPFQFWDAMREMSPDLVILEFDLPAIGGLELCRALRADPRFCALPVMFVSGYSDASTVHKCFEAGADDFVFKPVRGTELAARVAARLERHRQIAARPATTVPASPSAHGRLDQLLMKALRDDVPASLTRLLVTATVNASEGTFAGEESETRAFVNHLQRLLRSGLRGEDLVKYVGPRELLVGMAGAKRGCAEKRLKSILDRYAAALEMGIAEFPTDGRDLTQLLGPPLQA